MIVPDWPAPANVVALATSRQGLPGFVGHSLAPYEHFNLGDHVGDQPHAVAMNRGALGQYCGDACALQWLQQVHGTQVHLVDEVTETPPEADAAITNTKGIACVVMTADCLPVLFCDREGRQVAAAHAGWRGLCGGVLVATVNAFSSPPQQLMAWLGPAISSAHFEVGAEVKDAFLQGFQFASNSEIEAAFSASLAYPSHYYADLYALARAQLLSLGVSWIGGGDYCTFAESERFYSYRRDGVCGRQASLIYIDSPC